MRRLLTGICFLLAATCFTADAQYENTKIKTGQIAPELNYSNPKGKTYSLKEVNKGRYVLIDFWASWCGPCRRANPELVEVYEKYKGLKFKNAPKGFTVFSVSLDTNPEAWQKAIEKDNLLWEYHVSDLKKWHGEAATQYGIAFIPQAFLVGPDGKILGKYMNALEAVADLEQYVEKTNAKSQKSKNQTAGQAQK